MLYQSIVWLVLNFKMNQKHKEYPKAIPRPNQQNNKLDCIFVVERSLPSFFAKAFVLQPPFPQPKKRKLRRLRGSRWMSKSTDAAWKASGKMAFSHGTWSIPKRTFVEQWKKPRLFRLNLGLYYPIIWEFLEENMGNFWEFWNFDFVFFGSFTMPLFKKGTFLFCKKPRSASSTTRLGHLDWHVVLVPTCRGLQP